MWYLICHFGLVSPLLLPSPKAVLEKFWPLVNEGYMDLTLLQHTLASLGRINLTLLAVIVTAIPLGVAIGQSKLLQGIFDPIIEFYRPIPPLAYLPLLVIWFGIGELPKVLLIYLAIFAPVVIAVRDAVLHITPIN